jgi:phosphoglycolate phosphatase
VAAKLSDLTNISTFLFDLDGTLSDPGLGFVRSIRFAMDEMRIACPPDAELTRYIGPPLENSLKEIIGHQSTDRLISRALELYRQRYRKTGMFENTVYPGIVDLLDELAERGKVSFVATAKPTPFAEPIVAHFGWQRYFKKVYGTEFDGRYNNKADLVAHILSQQELDPASTVMIGDRRHDVEAGRQNQLRTVAITWGYGSLAELREAGPDLILSHPKDLAAIL